MGGWENPMFMRFKEMSKIHELSGWYAHIGVTCVEPQACMYIMYATYMVKWINVKFVQKERYGHFSSLFQYCENFLLNNVIFDFNHLPSSHLWTAFQIYISKNQHLQFHIAILYMIHCVTILSVSNFIISKCQRVSLNKTC